MCDVCVCAFVCVGACVCVCGAKSIYMFGCDLIWFCVCVCVCVGRADIEAERPPCVMVAKLNH